MTYNQAAQRLVVLCVFALTSFAVPTITHGQDVGESITRFDVEIAVQPDGRLEVIESILYDFGESDRHGIFRDIPRTYESPSEEGTETYKLLLENINVSSQTAPDSIQLEHLRDTYRFRIGDPDKTITGEHRYVLTYDVLNAVSFFDEFDEVYWNATGNEWDVPIEAATLSIELPENIDASLLRVFCYQGFEGSRESCENSVFREDESAGVLFIARNLSAGEGLTGALGFPKGVVPEIERERVGLTSAQVGFFIAVLSGLLSILFVFTLVHILRSKKRHAEPKGRNTIVREYDAPHALSPSEVGHIVDKRIDNHDITAEIVYLAEQGHIHILSVPEKGFFRANTQFYLLKRRGGGDALKAYQKLILTSLFSDKYILSKNEEGEFIDNVLKSKTITHDKDELVNKIESSESITPLKDLKKSFHVDLEKIRQSLLSEMFEKEYLVKTPSRPLVLYVLSVITLVALSTGLAFFVAAKVSTVLLIAAFIAELLFIIWGATAFPLYKRTEKGVRAKEHSLGLKEYLSIAEKERLEFHFNPKNNPMLFEKLLPFAIALKVDTLWAREMEDVYIRPDWYTDAGTSRLTVPHFYRSFAGFNTAVASSYASPSSSGSSGGGFSGGGGGGGGGGSW